MGQAERDRLAHARRWWILPVLCLSVLLVAIDSTIVNVALPTLAHDLHASTSDLQWIVDVYTVFFAGLLLVCGNVGDRLGRKRILHLGLVLFVLSSVAAALASTVGQLVAARMAMGISVALVYPATLALMTVVFQTRQERAIAVGVWSGVSGLAVGLGPVAGGLLLEHFAWGSIFLVNVPVGLAALLLGALLLPESRDPAPGRFDGVGALLSMGFIGLLVWTVIEAPSRGWDAAATLAGFTASALLLAGFVWWELRREDPLLDLGFFRNPRLSAASASIAIAFFGLFGFIFMITMYFQLVRGYTPLRAGVATLPFAVVMGILSPLAMLIVRWIGTKVVVAGGMLVMASGFVVVARAPIDAGYWSVVVVSMCLIAAGMALATGPSTDAILAALPESKAGVGSAINDTTREFGGAFGVALVGSMMSWYYGAQLATEWHALRVPDRFVTVGQESLASALTLAKRAAPIQGGPLAEAARDSFISGLHAGSIATAIARRAGGRARAGDERAASLGAGVSPRPRGSRALIRLSPPSSAPRLLCLPHAGGRAAAYRSWVAGVGDALELWALDLPGRHVQPAEPLAEDPCAVAAEMAVAATTLLDRPLAVFGHSMGALLAFEITREIERRGGAVAGLFVSGCAAPGAQVPRRAPPNADAQLVALLRRWGGTPAELLDDREFLDVALRSLRADLLLLDRYRPRPGKVRAPLTAFAGSEDSTAPVERMQSWAAWSVRWRGLRVLPGGHFFLHAAEDTLLDGVLGAFACA
jgi:DHA2 family multidrug resistance protein-like MFS transporter